MNPEKFVLSLQQDLLTLVCWSDEHGKTLIKLVRPELFEGDFRIIFERALEFWQKQNTAPKQHIADLLSDIIENKADRRAQTYRRILIQMFEIKDEINIDFILRSVGDFTWIQRAKSLTLDVADRLDAGGINSREQVETLWREFLGENQVSLDIGLRLSEYDKVLEYLNNVQCEFTTGIKTLDDAHIVPMRGKTWIIIASTGRGKTWGLIQIGKHAFQHRKKVCHITLEIETEEVMQRYYQALFGASKREDSVKIRTLRINPNDDRVLDKIVARTVESEFKFENNKEIREELQSHLEQFGTRPRNFIVKRFPMRSLSVEMLEVYLEQLEAVEHFIPDMVILDYPGIMKTDAKNHRISLGRVFESLRGLAQRRNFAFVGAHQGNRDSATAESVRATHVSEDWSIMQSTDFAVTYSQTDAEYDRGLARLWVAKGRSEADKFGILITQSYKTGQFVVESMRFPDQYARIMETWGTQNEETDSDDERD